MAIMDAWEAGLGKPSLGSKSLALQPMRATVPTGDRLVFFVAFTEGGGGRDSSLGNAIHMFALQIPITISSQ